MCSDVARASYTFKSGKINELINLLAREVEAPARWWDEGRIEAEPSVGTRWLRLGHEMLDGVQDELTCGAASANRRLMEPAVGVPRDVDRGSNETGLHTDNYRKVT